MLTKMPDFSFERAAYGDGHRLVAGIDEAGRGPWAGPVVAAAVILDADALSSFLHNSLDDSKALSAKKRDAAYAALVDEADIGVGIVDVDEIDGLNILQATMTAMTKAVGTLERTPDLALVDGNRGPDLPCAVTTVVKGDQRSLSIAAASIVAKVTRDRLMCDLAELHPGYGWERNMGYGTAEHQDALNRLGVTQHHRKSFAPIAKILSRLESS